MSIFRNYSRENLFCFSPPVMIATFAIEIVLMFWVFLKYRQTRLVQLASTMLFFLAVFQLAEFNICTEAWGVDSLTWARIGFVAITALPALGLHIIMLIGGWVKKWMLSIVYSSMLMFMIYFAFVGHGLTSSICGGNYVLFTSSPSATLWYTIYYYGLELFAVGLSIWLAKKAPRKPIKLALYGMMMAYLVLLIPTTTVNVINPDTIRAIPSIMCGFAIFTALIISLYVLPKVSKKS